MIKRRYLLIIISTLLLASCAYNSESSSFTNSYSSSETSSGNYIDSSSLEEEKEEDYIIDDAFIERLYQAPYQESKKMLLSKLNEDNLDLINKLAIEIGIYKPMFVNTINTTQDDGAVSTSYYTTAYILSPFLGNEAYRKAIDNVYFRKAILALFTHNDEEIMTTSHIDSLVLNEEKKYRKSTHYFEDTYKSATKLTAVDLKEGIEEAKTQFNLALENGLSNDIIELYVLAPRRGHTTSRIINRVELMERLVQEAFGNKVVVVEKKWTSYSWELYDLPQGNNIYLRGLYFFYAEATLSIESFSLRLLSDDHDDNTYDFIAHALRGFDHYIWKEALYVNLEDNDLEDIIFQIYYRLIDNVL